MIREKQRALDKSTRRLADSHAKLVEGEEKLIADAKEAARTNRIPTCKILAKQLIRSRAQCAKLVEVQGQLSAIGMQLQSMDSTHAVAEAMRDAGRVMFAVNRSLRLPALQKIVVTFQQESGLMDTNQEMMGDAVDGALSSTDDDAETDAFVSSVLDEIGIDLKQQMVDAPKRAIAPGANNGVRVAAKKPVAVTGAAAAAAAAATAAPPPPPPPDDSNLTAADLDLEARLNQLKRDG